MKVLFKGRQALLYAFLSTYLMLSFLVRLALLLWVSSNVSFSVFSIFKIFTTGLVYDIGVASFFSAIYAFYIWIFPCKLMDTRLDKVFTLQ